MSFSRITISVPEQVAAKAQRAVESGQVESVSGYFTGLAEREPDWAEARVVLDEMIEEAGGIPEQDRRWARSVLGLDDGGLTQHPETPGTTCAAIVRVVNSTPPTFAGPEMSVTSSSRRTSPGPDATGASRILLGRVTILA